MKKMFNAVAAVWIANSIFAMIAFVAIFVFVVYTFHSSEKEMAAQSAQIQAQSEKERQKVQNEIKATKEQIDKAFQKQKK